MRLSPSLLGQRELSSKAAYQASSEPNLHGSRIHLYLPKRQWSPICASGAEAGTAAAAGFETCTLAPAGFCRDAMLRPRRRAWRAGKALGRPSRSTLRSADRRRTSMHWPDGIAGHIVGGTKLPAGWTDLTPTRSLPSPLQGRFHRGMWDDLREAQDRRGERRRQPACRIMVDGRSACSPIPFFERR